MKQFTTLGHNPILPPEYHIPDGEPHVMPDGRLYLYGSQDRQEGVYCSHEYRVLSTWDLKTWTDHGPSFSSSLVPWTDQPLYAPDCVHRDGQYYLYFCHADGSEGVATATRPEGPFTQPVRLDCEGIDPAVFVDDDGSAYYYWAQFSSRGARLTADMQHLIPGSQVNNLITEAGHGFHEGSSLRKRNGTYYYVFADISRGRPTCLGYATSSSPLGPFQYRGVIIDNLGCDPETWNNHGSIEEFQGQWYVFYHRSSRCSRFMRRACVEPITFLPDGSIPEVEMTSQGAGSPLQPTDITPAYLACQVTGGCYLGQEQLTVVCPGNTAVYKYLDFQTSTTSFSCTAKGHGRMEIRLDTASGSLLGCIRLDSEAFTTYVCPVAPAHGLHALVLVFPDGYPAAFQAFQFKT